MAETEGERPAAGTVPPVAPTVRRLLQVAAFLVFLAGVQLFVFPLRTDEYFAWTIGSPMTAVFLGASYWSAVGLELSAAAAPSWARARIAIPAVFAFTAITFVVTMVHLDLFHLGDEHELNTRAVTWGWIAVYAVVPLLMVAAVLDQRRLGLGAAPAGGLPRPVRAVLVALAALLVALGAALLLDPLWADAAWPWPLTELTGRAIGAWLVGLGIAAGHARLLDDRPSLRPLGFTGVLFGGLQAIALLRHGGELDWGSAAAAGYVVALVLIAGVSAWALLPEPAERPVGAPAGGR